MTDSQDLDTVEMAEYRQLLTSHDWYYHYSDDHSVYKAGERENQRLVALRMKLDPSGTIWNQLCPSDFKLTPLPCYNAQ